MLQISKNLYQQDFQQWISVQADALRKHAWEQIDIENLVEEIESLGKQQHQELRNRLRILLAHLLKWEYQAEKRSRSWQSTIREQREQIEDLLSDSPSLKAYLEEALEISYSRGLALAVDETELDAEVFPLKCPYTLEEVLSQEFLFDS
ncbi:MAG: DUF29 domain-containing protein [Anaerolineae bacterium]|nr:DUF29 domain-containing protein [Gloeobacterales cyanobacterium ES-bin-313]